MLTNYIITKLSYFKTYFQTVFRFNNIMLIYKLVSAVWPEMCQWPVMLKLNKQTNKHVL
jgi:hypothetical protein